MFRRNRTVECWYSEVAESCGTADTRKEVEKETSKFSSYGVSRWIVGGTKNIEMFSDGEKKIDQKI